MHGYAESHRPSSSNVKGLAFSSPEEACQKYLPDIKRQAGIVIVLSHIGFAEDRSLANRVGGIDVIIGGHSHTKVVSPPVIGKTMVLQAWEHGKALGILDLTIEDGAIKKAQGRVYVNEAPFRLFRGMTIRHALAAAACRSVTEGLRVWDEWGNEVGLDGALHDGMRLIAEAGRSAP